MSALPPAQGRIRSRGTCSMNAVNEGRSAETPAKTYRGSCFWGTVERRGGGEPAAMGYCHCESCRSWSAAPVNAFSLWKADVVKVKAGAEHVGTFEKTAFSQRMYCKKCGGHLMSGHKPVGLVDVYAATIPSLKFVPAVHVNY